MPATTSAPLSAPELAAWRGLLRVHAGLVKRLDHELVAAYGLPLSSYEVLITLADAPCRRVRMAELADHALLSRSGMTRLVDRLEKDGLIRRARCDTDARGAYAELTEKGEELLARARPAHLDGVRRSFLGNLHPEDLERLAEIWEKVLPGGCQDLTIPD